MEFASAKFGKIAPGQSLRNCGILQGMTEYAENAKTCHTCSQAPIVSTRNFKFVEICRTIVEGEGYVEQILEFQYYYVIYLV